MIPSMQLRCLEGAQRHAFGLVVTVARSLSTVLLLAQLASVMVVYWFESSVVVTGDTM
jgi:hypothetical protein